MTICVVLFGLLQWLHAVELKTIYPRPPANTNFSSAPFDSLTIRDAAQKRSVHALFLRAQKSRPTLVTFHGNGHQLSAMMPWLKTLQRNGLGGLVVEYPGYGLSASESPTESGLYRDADTALTFLRESLGVKSSQTVLLGESLGTGVAVEMASRGYGAALVLLSPFTSLVSVALLHSPGCLRAG